MKFLGSSCEQWQSHLLPTSVPAARGNAVADNEAAAALGMRIFYDNRFSREGSGVACVSCHVPEHGFAERKPASKTIGQGNRNAPDLINAAWFGRSHFWDGKVDNLWSAPLFTFEQAEEMGSTRLQVAHALSAIYKTRYESVFGPLPDLSDAARFPASGKPGMPEFDAMAPQDKEVVDQVYVNAGKSLEAYMRKLAAGRSRFDDFLSGNANALSVDAQRGMLAFTRHGCGGCHSGPTFSDEQFHDLGVPRQPGQAPDAARAGGLTFVGAWQFSSAGRFADGTKGSGEADPSTDVRGELAGFRTPALRNVALTFPYGHDGAFSTLEQAIDAHARVLPRNAAPAGQDLHDIVELLRSLSGRPPQPPWNYWPGG